MRLRTAGAAGFRAREHNPFPRPRMAAAAAEEHEQWAATLRAAVQALDASVDAAKAELDRRADAQRKLLLDTERTARVTASQLKALLAAGGEGEESRWAARLRRGAEAAREAGLPCFSRLHLKPVRVRPLGCTWTLDPSGCCGFVTQLTVLETATGERVTRTFDPPLDLGVIGRSVLWSNRRVPPLALPDMDLDLEVPQDDRGYTPALDQGVNVNEVVMFRAGVPLLRATCAPGWRWRYVSVCASLSPEHRLQFAVQHAISAPLAKVVKFDLGGRTTTVSDGLPHPAECSVCRLLMAAVAGERLLLSGSQGNKLRVLCTRTLRVLEEGLDLSPAEGEAMFDLVNLHGGAHVVCGTPSMGVVRDTGPGWAPLFGVRKRVQHVSELLAMSSFLFAEGAVMCGFDVYDVRRPAAPLLYRLKVAPGIRRFCGDGRVEFYSGHAFKPLWATAANAWG